MMFRSLLFASFLVACHHEPPPRASESSAPAPANGSATPTTRPEDPEVAKLREFKDRACACRDKPCVDAVQKDLIAWAYAEKPSSQKLTDADAKAADAINTELEKCIVAAGGKL